MSELFHSFGTIFCLMKTKLVCSLKNFKLQEEYREFIQGKVDSRSTFALELEAMINLEIW
jgi:hypothetical protein